MICLPRMNKLLLLLTLMVLPGFLMPVQAQNLGEMDADSLKAFIQNYLMENPGVIVDSLENYQQNQEARAAQEQQKALVQFLAQGLDNDALPSMGPVDADVTFVEFFDYQCGYCKRAFPEMMDIVENDGNIRVIFIELPILGPQSRLAALAALAADKQGKYVKFHTALMTARGQLTRDRVFSIAHDMALDVAQLKQDMQEDALEMLLKDNLATAKSLGINGTPAFIIGTEIFHGAIPSARMEAAVKRQRAPGG